VTLGNHINRSVYFPTHLNVLAWDEAGNDARCEVEIYIDPVLSSPNWQHVEHLDPGCTVDMDTAGTYYSGGVHAAAVYFKGQISRELVSDYKSMTGGSFKNYAENGGTAVGTISAITKASPAVMTFSEMQSPIRESGYSLAIAGVAGMTEINGQTLYAKAVGLNQIALYTDAALTTPYNSTAHGTYTSGGTASGLYGDRLVFSIVAKPLTATTGTLNVRAVLSWKEINQ
jgi:hypothetical protein